MSKQKLSQAEMINNQNNLLVFSQMSEDEASFVVDKVKEALKKGANPYALDEMDKSAFDYAIESNNLESMHAMYQHAKHPDYYDTLEALTIQKLNEYAKKGDIISCNKILSYSENSDLPNIKEYVQNLTNDHGFKVLNTAYPINEDAFKTAKEEYLKNNPDIISHNKIEELLGKEATKDLMSVKSIKIAKDGADCDVYSIFESELKQLCPNLDTSSPNIEPKIVKDYAINNLVQKSYQLAKPKSISVNEFLDQKPLLNEKLTEALLHYSLENYEYHPELINKLACLTNEQNPRNKNLREEFAQKLVTYSNDNIEQFEKALIMDKIIKDLNVKVTGYKFGSLTEKTLDNLYQTDKCMKDKEAIWNGTLAEENIIAFHQAAQALEKEDLPQKLRNSININIIQSTNEYLGKQVKLGNLEAIKNITSIAADTKTFMLHRFEPDEPQNRQILEEMETLKAGSHFIDNKRLDDFSDFLNKKPNLGSDPLDNPHSLGKLAIETAIDNIETHPEILNKVIKLIKEQNKDNGTILEIFKADLIDHATNNEFPSSKRAGIQNALHDNFANELSFNNAEDTAAFVKAASTAEHSKLLNALILGNKDNHKIHLDYPELKSLYDNKHLEAVKSIFTPDNINNYLTDAGKNSDFEFISFIYQNKANIPVKLDEDNSKNIIKAATKLNNDKLLTKVFEDIYSTHNPDLIATSVKEIFSHEKELNNNIATIFNHIESHEHRDTLAKHILQNNNFIEKLNPSNINLLAQFYNPERDSELFLHKFMTNNHTQGINFENYYDKIQLNLPQYDFNNDEKVKISVNDYLITANKEQSSWDLIKGSNSKNEEIKQKITNIKISLSNNYKYDLTEAVEEQYLPTAQQIVIAPPAPSTFEKAITTAKQVFNIFQDKLKSSTDSTQKPEINYDDNRKNITSLMQGLVNNPQIFKHILNLSDKENENKLDNLLGTIRNLPDGTIRTGIGLATSFGVNKKNLISGMFKSGLLENLVSIEPEQAQVIFAEIMQSSIVKKQGLDKIDPENLNSFIDKSFTIIQAFKDHPQVIEELGNVFAELTKNSSKGEERTLLTTQLVINLANAAETPEMQKSLLDFASQSVKLLDEHRLSVEEKLPDAEKLKSQLENSELTETEKNNISEKISLINSRTLFKNKINEINKELNSKETSFERKSNIPKIKESLIEQLNYCETELKLTPLDKMLLNIKDKTKLHPGEMSKLVELSGRNIANLLSDRQIIRNIGQISSLENKLPAILEVSKALINNQRESLIVLCKNKEFQAIVRNNPIVQEKLGGAADKAVEILPSTIEHLANIATISLSKNPQKIKEIIEAQKNLKTEDNNQNLFNLLNKGIDLLKDPEIIASGNKYLEVNQDKIIAIIDYKLNEMRTKEKQEAELATKEGNNPKSPNPILKILDGKTCFELLQKTNNPQGLKALSKIIKKPTILNACRVLYKTGSLYLAIGAYVKINKILKNETRIDSSHTSGNSSQGGFSPSEEKNQTIPELMSDDYEIKNTELKAKTAQISKESARINRDLKTSKTKHKINSTYRAGSRAISEAKSKVRNKLNALFEDNNKPEAEDIINSAYKAASREISNAKYEAQDQFNSLFEDHNKSEAEKTLNSLYRAGSRAKSEVKSEVKDQFNPVGIRKILERFSNIMNIRTNHTPNGNNKNLEKKSWWID